MPPKQPNIINKRLDKLPEFTRTRTLRQPANINKKLRQLAKSGNLRFILQQHKENIEFK